MNRAKTYYNLFGEQIREETIGFDGITKIFINIEYDLKGRVSRLYEPCFEGNTANYTENIYDIYGRIEQLNTPTGNITMVFDSKEITITDQSNQSIAKKMNAYGDVIEASDNGGTIVYDFNSAGLPESITTTGSSSISLVYDLHGNRTSIIDPNAGTVTTAYDAFGNLLSQFDANGSYTMEYDIINRITKKTGTDGVTDFNYFTTGGGLGQIESIDYNNINQSFTYDDYGRLLTTTEIIDNKDYSYAYTYDEFGRESTITYPSGFGITNTYNDFGYLAEISQTGGSMIWQADEMSAMGQYVQISKGNGKTTTYTYDAYHLPKTIETPGIAEFEYGFDPLTGNLDYRMDITMNTVTGIRRNLREDFAYDNLNRLTGAKIEGEASNYLDLSFQANGNIATKTDAGTYTYDDTKLHAVTGVTNDLSIIPEDDDQLINYTAFNKIKDITEGNFSLSFTYGADHQRRKTMLTDGGSIIKTKYFLGAYEEEITVANGTRKIHYIAGGDGLAAVYIIEDGSSTGELNYTYTDHLGSIVAIEDKNGLVHEQSFDPWGRRRNYENWTYEGIQSFTLLDRGYTGHEHLNQFTIINMNGRLYDPVLGRMLSPDPFIQMPDFSQNFNRYSYVFNNPLIYTDPDGEIIQYIVGGILGGLAGNSIANAKGVTGLAKFGYILGGAAIGAVTGGIAANIAASGGIMANTASIVAGTYTNSVGMHALSGGMTDINIGFGAFSYNVSQNSFGFIGKPGNSTMQNIGYFFGAAANISDIMAGFNGTSVNVHTNTVGPEGHSAATGDDINISVGPGQADHLKNGWLARKFHQMYGKTGWETYSDAGDPAIHLELNNLNSKLLKKMSANLGTESSVTIPAKVINGVEVLGAYRIPAYKNLLGTGIARYGLVGNSCVSYVSRALWYTGVPNIGIHPYLLHASLLFRQTALTNNSYFIGF